MVRTDYKRSQLGRGRYKGRYPHGRKFEWAILSRAELQHAELSEADLKDAKALLEEL